MAHKAGSGMRRSSEAVNAPKALVGAWACVLAHSRRGPRDCVPGTATSSANERRRLSAQRRSKKCPAAVANILRAVFARRICSPHNPPCLHASLRAPACHYPLPCPPPATASPADIQRRPTLILTRGPRQPASVVSTCVAARWWTSARVSARYACSSSACTGAAAARRDATPRAVREGRHMSFDARASKERYLRHQPRRQRKAKMAAKAQPAPPGGVYRCWRSRAGGYNTQVSAGKCRRGTYGRSRLT